MGAISLTYEELQIEYENLNIKEMDLSEVNGLKGLYVDGNIAIQEGMTSAESVCTLAEEIGHHETSSGDILNLSIVRNRKQERTARLWAYDKQIGLSGIIYGYRCHCQNRHDLADCLGVTEEFLQEAFECYREKYGCSVELDGYTIFFEPALAVMERFI